MPKEDVKKFYLMVEKDEVLRKELLEMDKRYQQKDIKRVMLPALIEKEIIPIAKKRRLNFSTEEFMEYLEEKRNILTEEDLLDVSGGLSPRQAAIGLSGVLLLSIGAGIGTQLIVRSIDNQPEQRMEQRIGREKKTEGHNRGKGLEGENKGKERDSFKKHREGENQGEGRDNLKMHEERENRQEGRDGFENHRKGEK
ncbi:MAG: hypothetical protein RUMPE_00737 [Eubacteriales bacterium SKADARSKE-1]|nr:hypothetical protein [Eubacteriales bacterium SKADARSKE-1]